MQLLLLNLQLLKIIMLKLKKLKKIKFQFIQELKVLADVVSLKKNIIITGSHGKTTIHL